MTSVIALAWGGALLVLIALGREVARVLLARPPARTTSIELRAEAPSSPAPAAALPAVVWTYWASDTIPPFIVQCLRNWRRHAPDHEVRLVGRSTIADWLGDDWRRATFDTLPPFRQADWLRLQLLARHGGIWIDASTLLTTDLGWVHDRHRASGDGVVGFYIDRYTRDRAYPLIENWFIAATPADPFIVAWAAELDRALALGETAYLAALRGSGELDAAAQGIPAGMQAYLVMHLAAGCVSRRRPDLRRMSLLRAEDVAYAYHAGVGWRKRHLYARLALTTAPVRVPALIKLRSGDRAVVERGLARGWWFSGSLLARLLAP